MNDPERALPSYCRKKLPLRNDGTLRWQPPPLPIYISRVKQHGNSKARHWQTTPWPYPAGLLEPLYWFWASIEWYHNEKTSAPGNFISTTSFAELTIASNLRQALTHAMGGTTTWTNQHSLKGCTYSILRLQQWRAYSRVRYTRETEFKTPMRLSGSDLPKDQRWKAD